jgi:hypothetical protein
MGRVRAASLGAASSAEANASAVGAAAASAAAATAACPAACAGLWLAAKVKCAGLYGLRPEGAAWQREQAEAAEADALLQREEATAATAAAAAQLAAAEAAEAVAADEDDELWLATQTAERERSEEVAARGARDAQDLKVLEIQTPVHRAVYVTELGWPTSGALISCPLVTCEPNLPMLTTVLEERRITQTSAGFACPNANDNVPGVCERKSNGKLYCNEWNDRPCATAVAEVEAILAAGELQLEQEVGVAEIKETIWERNLAQAVDAEAVLANWTAQAGATQLGATLQRQLATSSEAAAGRERAEAAAADTRAPEERFEAEAATREEGAVQGFFDAGPAGLTAICERSAAATEAAAEAEAAEALALAETDNATVVPPAPAEPEAANATAAWYPGPLMRVEPGDRLVISCGFAAEAILASLTGMDALAQAEASLAPRAGAVRGGHAEGEELCVAQMMVQPVEAFQYTHLLSAYDH